MAVDRADMMGTAIGILTVAYEAVDRRRRGEPDDGEYASSMALVAQSFTEFQMSLPQVPVWAAPYAQSGAEAAAMEFGKRMDWLLGGLVKGYMDIVRAYLEDCPNANIPSVLQRTARELPS
jgi:hypothetical protein